MINIAGQMEPDPQINATAEAQERDLLTAINEKLTTGPVNTANKEESEQTYQFHVNEILPP